MASAPSAAQRVGGERARAAGSSTIGRQRAVEVAHEPRPGGTGREGSKDRGERHPARRHHGTGRGYLPMVTMHAALAAVDGGAAGNTWTSVVGPMLLASVSAVAVKAFDVERHATVVPVWGAAAFPVKVIA